MPLYFGRVAQCREDRTDRQLDELLPPRMTWRQIQAQAFH